MTLFRLGKGHDCDGKPTYRDAFGKKKKKERRKRLSRNFTPTSSRVQSYWINELWSIMCIGLEFF